MAMTSRSASHAQKRARHLPHLRNCRGRLALRLYRRTTLATRERLPAPSRAEARKMNMRSKIRHVYGCFPGRGRSYRVNICSNIEILHSL